MSEPHSYAGRLGIWIVGVRDKNPNHSVWGQLWKPTSLKWFNTRQECWKFINYEIPAANHEMYQYKPLRYVPKG